MICDLLSLFVCLGFPKLLVGFVFSLGCGFAEVLILVVETFGLFLWLL